MAKTKIEPIQRKSTSRSRKRKVKRQQRVMTQNDINPPHVKKTIMVGRRVESANLEDECVIYYSKIDRTWVAYGLHTDLTGFGRSVFEALTTLLGGYEDLIAFAKKHGGVEVYEEAPSRIQRLLNKAIPVPSKIYDAAYERVHDPEHCHVRPTIKYTRDQIFKAKVRERK